MEARDLAMEGTFHTILVGPLEDTFQETLDKDNYWNRGATAKYIPFSSGKKNAEERCVLGDCYPKSAQIPKVDAPRHPPTPFRHWIQPRTQLGLHVRDLTQPHHQEVFCYE